MESYLVKRAQEQNRRFEAINRLHLRLQFLIDSFGKPGSPNDPENDVFVTPHVPLVEGWEVCIYKPGEDDIAHERLINPIEVSLSPTMYEDLRHYTLPYLDDAAAFWVEIGENGAYDRDTESVLPTEDIENLFRDVIEIVEPGLMRQRESSGE